MLEAVYELVGIESGKIDVVRGFKELVEMLVCSEGLRFSSLFVFADVEALVAGDAVVERGGGDWDFERTIGDDFGLIPAGGFIPVYGEHVIRVGLAKLIVILIRWLHFWNTSFFDLKVLGIESTKL